VGTVRDPAPPDREESGKSLKTDITFRFNIAVAFLRILLSFDHVRKFVNVITRSIRLLALALLAFVAVACADGIPDPPGTFQHPSIECAPASHTKVEAENAELLIYYRSESGPITSRSALYPVAENLRDFDNLSRWRAAADSSPPK
jgi:hypothetical protein